MKTSLPDDVGARAFHTQTLAWIIHQVGWAVPTLRFCLSYKNTPSKTGDRPKYLDKWGVPPTGGRTPW
ncbi:MAG: hypothetical protein ACFB8W_21540 [Elainellaceae cyanobacterium]